ncbi:VOC family protein [Gordonia polyisoprenivorans]|uniref:VOC family protein n=1 Tax=Gordonia polyisoprenivorans TaxID=84595 RepID=UPI000B99F18E|nr:VOC family protein [Gordonia polyisoprenivorans]OZC33575.1 glyoxalase [Gordonia polyisoprenivorans]UZF56991.1 glyoxalase [Gordonia polyisoprenivorans]
MNSAKVTLSFVTLVCTDIDTVSDFYANLFRLQHVTELEGDYFRALRLGDTILGFNTPIAYDLLNLPPSDLAASAPAFWTFEADSEATVDELAATAVAAGATYLKQPFRTYYNAWQAVLLDPEANVFRINKSQSSTEP